jgi:hypothetical protein
MPTTKRFKAGLKTATLSLSIQQDIKLRSFFRAIEIDPDAAPTITRIEHGDSSDR